MNKIGIYITGINDDEHFIKKSKGVTFFDIMNTVNKLLTIGNINDFDIIPKENSSTLDMCVEITSKDISLCELGKIKKEILASFDISQDVYYAEFEWTSFIENFNKEFTYKEIPKFPQVQRDLSLVIQKDVKFRDIKSVIDFNKLKSLKKVSLYDIYEGESIGKDQVAYSLRFILQDENKTLGEKEINSTMENLIKVFEKKLNAEIRK